MTAYVACPHCGQTHECPRAPAVTPGMCGHTIAGVFTGTMLVCGLQFGHWGMHTDGTASWTMARGNTT